MRLLYFGWVRTRIGMGGEEVTPPAEVTDVEGLIGWLQARSDAYAEALEDLSIVRVAVNQEIAEFDSPVAPGDEVALFPPMTGG
jgi:molybdopterin synthase sulfur carrier subunit